MSKAIDCLASDYDPLPFILPEEPSHSRDTCQDWSRWRGGRDFFVPAPRLTWRAYEALHPQRKTLYNLHRTATFANLPVLETPMSAKLTEQIETRIKINAFDFSPATCDGVMVTGGGFQGKTETVCSIAAAFEDFWRRLHELRPKPGTRDLMIPVAYVQTPVTAKPKSTCEAILDFYGARVPKSATLPQQMQAVRACLKDNQTKVLILDDITRLRLHRADDQDAFDLIRGLMSMHVTLILVGVGIRTSGLLRGAAYDTATDQWVFLPGSAAENVDQQPQTQHERRFSLMELDRFRYDTPAAIDAWINHLAGLEEQLCLLEPEAGMLTSGDMPEYLYRRTNGVVGLLNRLVKPACERAMAPDHTGKAPERLSKALFERVTITLDDIVGRDPDAGEIPPVPAHRPPAESSASALDNKGPKSRRRRNSSFDDSGLASATG